MKLQIYTVGMVNIFRFWIFELGVGVEFDSDFDSQLAGTSESDTLAHVILRFEGTVSRDRYLLLYSQRTSIQILVPNTYNKINLRPSIHNVTSADAWPNIAVPTLQHMCLITQMNDVDDVSRCLVCPKQQPDVPLN